MKDENTCYFEGILSKKSLVYETVPLLAATTTDFGKQHSVTDWRLERWQHILYLRFHTLSICQWPGCSINCGRLWRVYRHESVLRCERSAVRCRCLWAERSGRSTADVRRVKCNWAGLGHTYRLWAFVSCVRIHVWFQPSSAFFFKWYKNVKVHLGNNTNRGCY